MISDRSAITTMKIIDIDAQSAGCDPEVPAHARRMYDLLGSNMTALFGDDGRDWRSEAEFATWHADVFVAGLSQGAVHILLSDAQGLRGFLTFTAPSDAVDIFVNEVEIRPSSRKDSVTFRRLMERFASRIEILPHTTSLTYANNSNPASQQLIQKLGFRIHSQTEKGTRFIAAKADVLERLQMRRPNNGMQRTGYAGR